MLSCCHVHIHIMSNVCHFLPIKMRGFFPCLECSVLFMDVSVLICKFMIYKLYRIQYTTLKWTSFGSGIRCEFCKHCIELILFSMTPFWIKNHQFMTSMLFFSIEIPLKFLSFVIVHNTQIYWSPFTACSKYYISFGGTSIASERIVQGKGLKLLFLQIENNCFQ